MQVRYIFSNIRINLTILFILALILRVIVIYMYAWHTGLHFEYAQIASNIVSGNGYSWDWFGQKPLQPSAAFNPIYTYFLAFFIAIFDSPARVILIAQAIINAFCVFPAYWIGRHLNNRATGLICAVIFAVLPEIVYASTSMVTESISNTLVLAAIYFYLKLKDTVKYKSYSRHYLLFGAYIGFLALVNSSLLLLLPAFIIGFYFVGGYKKNFLKIVFLLSVGSILVITPWIIRNYVYLGKPVIRTTFGYNLWRGNYPGASGTGRVDPQNKDVIVLNEDYYKYLKTNVPDSEIGMDSFFTAEAINFIKEEPLRFIKLTLLRVLYFVTYDPTHPLTKNIFYLGGYIFILVFGVWGGILLKKLKRLDLAFVFIPFFHLILYSLVMVLPRYRMILVWILMIFSSIAIADLLSKLKKNNRITNR